MPPTHEQFRAAGMSGLAAGYPRSELQCRMFAAFLNVPVEKLPETHRYFANEHMRDAWERVEAVVREQASIDEDELRRDDFYLFE